MKDILSIRLNKQDKEMIQGIKFYLEDQYKDLDPAFLRVVTDTDVLKFSINKTWKVIKEYDFLTEYNKKTD